LSACSSSSVSPAGGLGSNDDPPPQISATTRSSDPRPATASQSVLLAAIPAVIFYNKLSADSDRVLGTHEAFADEFATILSRQLDS
jgi:hypothetical protein